MTDGMDTMVNESRKNCFSHEISSPIEETEIIQMITLLSEINTLQLE